MKVSFVQTIAQDKDKWNDFEKGVKLYGHMV